MPLELPLVPSAPNPYSIALSSTFLWRSTQLLADPAKTLKQTFQAVDKQLAASELKEVAITSGTTASVLYIKNRSAWVAWVGDSRCVKGSRQVTGEWEVSDLTTDHHPSEPLEKKRIEAAGGVVTGGSADEPARIWYKVKWNGMGLANSRLIGVWSTQAVSE